MRRASLLGIVSIAIGCNAITGIGDYSSSGDALGPDGEPNVLENGNFEKAACAGWTGDSAELVEIDGVAHSGSRSCRVCSIGTTTVFGISQDRDGQKGLVPGTQYVAEAWVSAAVDQPPTHNVGIVLTLEEGDGTLVDRNETPGPVDLDSKWQRVQTTLTFQPGNTTTFEVLARFPGGCFFVDDASMYPAN